MCHESLHDQFHAEVLGARLVSEFPHQGGVILNVGSFENLVYLRSGLLGFKALLDDVGRELLQRELGEAALERACDLQREGRLLEIEDVLHPPTHRGAGNQGKAP